MKRGKDVEFNGIDLPLDEEIGQIEKKKGVITLVFCRKGIYVRRG